MVLPHALFQLSWILVLKASVASLQKEASTLNALEQLAQEALGGSRVTLESFFDQLAKVELDEAFQMPCGHVSAFSPKVSGEGYQLPKNCALPQPITFDDYVGSKGNTYESMLAWGKALRIENHSISLRAAIIGLDGIIGGCLKQEDVAATGLISGFLGSSGRQVSTMNKFVDTAVEVKAYKLLENLSYYYFWPTVAQHHAFLAVCHDQEWCRKASYNRVNKTWKSHLAPIFAKDRVNLWLDVIKRGEVTKSFIDESSDELLDLVVEYDSVEIYKVLEFATPEALAERMEALIKAGSFKLLKALSDSKIFGDDCNFHIEDYPLPRELPKDADIKFFMEQGGRFFPKDELLKRAYGEGRVNIIIALVNPVKPEHISSTEHSTSLEGSEDEEELPRRDEDGNIKFDPESIAAYTKMLQKNFDAQMKTREEEKEARIRFGSEELMTYALVYGGRSDPVTVINAQHVELAATKGHQEALLWAGTNGYDISNPIIKTKIALNGHFELFERLSEFFEWTIDQKMANKAAEENRFNVVKWIYSKSELVPESVHLGNVSIEMLKWVEWVESKKPMKPAAGRQARPIRPMTTTERVVLTPQMPVLPSEILKSYLEPILSGDAPFSLDEDELITDTRAGWPQLGGLTRLANPAEDMFNTNESPTLIELRELLKSSTSSFAVGIEKALGPAGPVSSAKLGEEGYSPRINKDLAMQANTIVLEWLWNNHKHLITTEVEAYHLSRNSDEKGSRAKVVWFLNTTDLTENTIPIGLDWMASTGLVADLEWAFKDDFDYSLTISKEALDAAAAAGHFDFLMWIHERASQMPPNTFWHLNKSIIGHAVNNGHFDIAGLFDILLNPQHTPIDIPLEVACQKGNLESLQWAHSHYNICPTVEDQCEVIRRGYTSLVKWMTEVNCITGENISVFLFEAIKNGHDEIFGILYERFGDSLSYAVALEICWEYGNLRLFKILLPKVLVADVQVITKYQPSVRNQHVHDWFFSQHGQNEAIRA